MSESLESAFGKEFAEKMEARKKFQTQERVPQFPRLIVQGTTRQKIIAAAKNALKPEAPQSNYLHDDGNLYHIILIETGTQEEMRLKEMQYGQISITAMNASNKIWLGVDKDRVDEIKPEGYYVLVGFMKLKPSTTTGKPFRTFRVDGVITMDEIARYKG